MSTRPATSPTRTALSWWPGTAVGWPRSSSSWRRWDRLALDETHAAESVPACPSGHRMFPVAGGGSPLRCRAALIVTGVAMIGGPRHADPPARARCRRAASPSPNWNWIEQQLGQAETLNVQNQDVAGARALRQGALHEDPTNPGAPWRSAGWLQWKNGFVPTRPVGHRGTGERKSRRPSRSHPSFYESRYLFLGVILVNQDHNAKGAVTQFAAFLADDPPLAVVECAAPSIGLLTSTYAAAALSLRRPRSAPTRQRQRTTVSSVARADRPPRRRRRC